VIARLTTELTIDLPVRDFFANPTIALVAAHLSRLTGHHETPDAIDLSADIRRRMPVIEPFYFDSSNQSLFAVHYRPVEFSVSAKRNQCVVIASSIGHEYTRGHRNLQQIAKELAQRGIDVLRFDYAGVGNSSGDAIDLSFESMIDNLHDAIAQACRRTGLSSVSVLGVRWGATVASSIEDTRQRIDQQVFWDPLISGAEFIAMVELFHRRELVGLTRFNRARRTKIDQVYGERYTDAKRQSLMNAQLNLGRSTPTTWVRSTGEAADERLVREGRVIDVSDPIHWSNSRFTESAFSAPNVQARIIQVLEGDES
jgi:pimeloyl-ACP methyl ester carboxylesterase